MNKLLTKIVGVALGATMAVGVGVAAAKGVESGLKPAYAASVTYQHVFNAKPSTGNSINLSGINWNISATQLGSYNKANYAGVQIGTSKANGNISLTSTNTWGGQSGTYYGKTKITEVRLWLNKGGTSVTPTVTIGGVSAVSDGTEVVKNSTAGDDWTKTSKVTFTPGTNGNSGTVVINVDSVKAGYVCCMEIDCEEPSSTTCTLSYDANGAETGTVPASQTVNKNSTFNLAANSGNLAKSGYVFSGWNTSADGQGTHYNTEASYTIGTDNVTLYAEWTVDPVLSVAVSGTMTKTAYGLSESWDPSGLTVTATLNSGATMDVSTLASWTYSPADPATMGLGTSTLNITATYSGISNTTPYGQTVTVKNLVTVSSTINQIQEANGWTVSSGSNVYMYKTFALDGVITISTTGDDNCGSCWGTTTKEWRLYQNKSGNIIATAKTGYAITSVKYTFNRDNNGVLLDGTDTVASGTAVELDSVQSIEFTVGNSTTATNGQIKITAIEVTYTQTGSAKTLSSIAVSGDYKTSFIKNEAFSFGGTVTATYSDSTTDDVTASSEFSGYSMSTTGNQTVTVSYTEAGTTKTTSYGITVNPGVDSVSVSPAESIVLLNETVTLTATVTGDSGVAKTVTWSSSDDSIATVDSNGLVTPVTAGLVTITATSTVNPAIVGTAKVKAISAAEPANKVIFGTRYCSDTEIGSTVFTKSEFTVSFDDSEAGTNKTKYYENGQAVRNYGNSTFTVTATGDNLTSIVLTFADGSGNNTITPSVGNYENGTWEGDAASVTFTIGVSSGNHIRISAIEAATSTPPVEDFFISGPINDNLDFYVEDIGVMVVKAPEGCEVFYGAMDSNSNFVGDSESYTYDSQNKTFTIDFIVYADEAIDNLDVTFYFYAADGYSNYTEVTKTIHIVNPTGLSYARTFATWINQVCAEPTQSHWDDLSSKWDQRSAETKAFLTNAHYTLDGDDVTKGDDTHYEIAEAISRYDYMVKTYHFDNFMGRTIESNRITPINTVSSNVAIIIVTTISLVSVSALGAYFLLRKKKEER